MSGPGAGFEFKPKDVAWNKRDSLLFALSIGADIDELHFVFENSPNFQAFPTYANILPIKGTSQDVIDFGKSVISERIPGVPILKPNRIIDAHRAMTWYKPLPATSEGKAFELQTKVIGVYDKGKAGTVLEQETVLREKGSKEPYVKLVGSTFFIGQGNWGGPKGPSPASFPPPKDKRPDGVETHQTTSQSPLIYRLNGDYNPLHVTPSQGKSMGFGGAIMHGLFTYNIAAHAVLKNVGKSDPANLRHFSARFQAPVRPGDKLVTEIWRTGEFEDGFEEIRFVTRIEGGKVVLSNGRALVRTGV
ncbi:hypothetical protein PRZ48_009012 [Zasmidium cellare]|uniref:MaoC-like domain-containing protein n=1 Tax=Zasmidium cellare TaxID=395010 RepID=A0ABR0EI41_ZASCE|nr:hypothetical protein PRZ48_009012 [Zasmidium cellare]